MPVPVSFTIISSSPGLVYIPSESSFSFFDVSLFIESSALSIRFPVIVTRASEGIEMSSFFKHEPSFKMNFTLHSDERAIFPTIKAAKEGFSMEFITLLIVSLWIIEMF